METQVLIIGGGAAGVMMARELSRYKVDVTLIEKKADVCFGVSKASNGYIYSGMEWNVSVGLKSIVEGIGGVTKKSEELKEKMCAEGYRMWKPLFAELDIPSSTMPRMLVATNDEEMYRMGLVEAETAARNMPCRRLTRDEVLTIEPHVNKNVIAGLYDDEVGLTHVYPWDVVHALAENARENGVKIMLNTAAIGISQKNGSQIVETTRGPIKTEYIINACGAQGADVAKMADACDFSLQFFKGHLILMDKKTRNLINNSVAILAGPGRLKSINPVQSGNLLLCALYSPTENPADTSADRSGLDELFGMCQDVIPELSKKDVISYFAVSRVYSARDPDEYIIEFAPNNPRFINMILRMPGFLPLPVIARNVVGMLADHGLSLTPKDDFNPCRKRIPQFSELSDVEREKLIASDPRYGHVICRCESVTEGEITEAIRRGATTLDGVKFRTRAGMGRCQGGFCGPRVVEILARELNIKPTEVTKNGGNSRVLFGETKELPKEGQGVK